jgi:hypothetical protein
MTIATKNGVPIIKDGSIATGCGCCKPSEECNLSIPAVSDVVTVSAHSSIYGESLRQLPHAAPPFIRQSEITSKQDSFSGYRYLNNLVGFGSSASKMLAASWYGWNANATPPLTPRESATWVRFGFFEMDTYCQNLLPFASSKSFRRLDCRFNTFTYTNSELMNVSVTLNMLDEPPLVIERTSVNSFSNSPFVFSLSASQFIESVVLSYQFTTTTDSLFHGYRDQSIPASETITFRGFYNSTLSQLMYRFTENYPLP